MTKILQLFLIAIAYIFLATPAVSFASDPIMISESISAKATIVKVNKKTRELTLRDDQGNEETVIANIAQNSDSTRSRVGTRVPRRANPNPRSDG